MPLDTPPPDDDALSDGLPAGLDDIEIIEDYEIEENFEATADFADEAKLTFTRHTDQVFCCALNESCTRAVSGGQDDIAYVWNPLTGDLFMECTGHTDSVFATSFCHDSSYFATADMGGIIKVWDDRTAVFEQDIGEDLTFVEWNPKYPVVFAGSRSGNCWMWKIPEGHAKVFPGPNSPCIAGKVLPNGTTSVVGYEDGSIRFFDLRSTTTVHVISGSSGHDGSVTVLTNDKEGGLVLTGALDGTSKLIKATDGTVLFTLRCEPEDLEKKSVESVGFFPSHPLIATATSCGSLAIWDMSTQVRRLQCEQESSITKLICDPSEPLVFTAGADGVVRLVDGRTGQQEKEWEGHLSAIYDFTVSKDGNTILTSSQDHTCKIFDVRM